MDLEDVRLFTEVVRYESISAAARRNSMTQQTLSRRIIALEREAGQSLLVRSTPLAPTPAGRIFLRYAYELLGVEDEMRKSLKAIGSLPTLSVKVRRYETDSFFHILARLSESLGRLHPNIEFELVPDNQGDCDLVRDGRLDIGFVRDIYGASEVTSEVTSEAISEATSEASDVASGLSGPAGTPAVSGTSGVGSYRPFARFVSEFELAVLASNSFPFFFGVPEGHPVLRLEAPTLADIGAFRIAIPSFASKGAIPEAVSALLERKGIQPRIDIVYSTTMLEYYAGAAPTSVCLFNERYSPESLASQHKHYVAVAPSDDEYTVSAAAVYLASNNNPALPCVLEELRAADEDSLRKSLC